MFSKAIVSSNATYLIIFHFGDILVVQIFVENVDLHKTLPATPSGQVNSPVHK